MLDRNPTTRLAAGAGPSRTSNRGAIPLISPTGSDLLRAWVSEANLPLPLVEDTCGEDSWPKVSRFSVLASELAAMDSFLRDGGVGRRTSGPIP
jgi:hypothetical protein